MGEGRGGEGRGGEGSGGEGRGGEGGEGRGGEGSPPSHFGDIFFKTFLLRDIRLRHLTIAGT